MKIAGLENSLEWGKPPNTQTKNVKSLRIQEFFISKFIVISGVCSRDSSCGFVIFPSRHASSLALSLSLSHTYTHTHTHFSQARSVAKRANPPPPPPNKSWSRAIWISAFERSRVERVTHHRNSKRSLLLGRPWPSKSSSDKTTTQRTHVLLSRCEMKTCAQCSVLHWKQTSQWTNTCPRYSAFLPTKMALPEDCYKQQVTVTTPTPQQPFHSFPCVLFCVRKYMNQKNRQCHSNIWPVYHQWINKLIRYCQNVYVQFLVTVCSSPAVVNRQVLVYRNVQTFQNQMVYLWHIVVAHVSEATIQAVLQWMNLESTNWRFVFNGQAVVNFDKTSK